MATLEEKIDIILNYIATDDESRKAELKQVAINALHNPSTDIPKKNINDLIFELFKELGVPYNLFGREYIMRALVLCLNDRTYLKNITSGLYAQIASDFGTSPTRVERAIRYCIDVTFDRGDYDSIARLFGNTVSVHKGKLTNSEFLTGCVETIKMRMKKDGYNG